VIDDSSPQGWMGGLADEARLMSLRKPSRGFQPSSAWNFVGTERAAGATEVRIGLLGMTARVDPEGNSLFRSMPSGTFTIGARIGGRIVNRTVILPARRAGGCFEGAPSPRRWREG
jgi:hypothetical protein